MNRTMLVAMLSWGCLGSAHGQVPFVDADRTIPGGLEWNKEVVARSAGTIRCEVGSKAPIAVTLIAERTYRAAMRGDPEGMVREDLILTSDHPDGRFSQDIALSSAGSYWFIVENQSHAEQRLTLRCWNGPPMDGSN